MNLSEQIAALDWPRITAELNQHGFATTGPLLTPAQCTELASGYPGGELNKMFG